MLTLVPFLCETCPQHVVIMIIMKLSGALLWNHDPSGKNYEEENLNPEQRKKEKREGERGGTES